MRIMMILLLAWPSRTTESALRRVLAAWALGPRIVTSGSIAGRGLRGADAGEGHLIPGGPPDDGIQVTPGTTLQPGPAARSMGRGISIGPVTEARRRGPFQIRSAARAQDPIELTMGQPRTGRLEVGDATPDLERFEDYYAFTGIAGQTVRVELVSEGFDCYLKVIAPDGSGFENDDFEDSRVRSVIEFRLDQQGRYLVIVTSYGEGETGTYRLTARVRTDLFLRPPAANLGKAPRSVRVRAAGVRPLKHRSPRMGYAPVTDLPSMAQRPTPDRHHAEESFQESRR